MERREFCRSALLGVVIPSLIPHDMYAQGSQPSLACLQSSGDMQKPPVSTWPTSTEQDAT